MEEENESFRAEEPSSQQVTARFVSVGCQTEPNLIDKLIDNHVRKQLDDVDLYQEYVRSAQCAQFWPLDKNPIRSLVPAMVKVDLPEQYLKNESLMFDLVQAITNNSKLVNLLAKYIHHIVPNVIISKRIDLIPLITCTIRVCRDTGEQERLISLLFNLIKRPNEEQRRMILSGIIVVLQVSPHQSSSLLLPNLWDHVTDKFPERRILLAESCSALAHYVRPVMRTNLILSILIQLLKDKNAAVRSAASKSFACLLTLIMDRNDEVFDACLSATEDIIQDVLKQTPVDFCEHRYELEQMRFCALETVYPLLCMWAVKLNRFKLELAQFYLAKAERYFENLLSGQPSSANATTATSQLASPQAQSTLPSNGHHSTQSPTDWTLGTCNQSAAYMAKPPDAAIAAAIARRRTVFFESRSSSLTSGSSSSSSSNNIPSSFFASSASRRQSAFVQGSGQPLSAALADPTTNSAMLTSQRAIGAYLKMLNYLIPFVFSDAVHSCAWLSKSNLHLPHPNSPPVSATKPKDACKPELKLEQNSRPDSGEAKQQSDLNGNIISISDGSDETEYRNAASEGSSLEQSSGGGSMANANNNEQPDLGEQTSDAAEPVQTQAPTIASPDSFVQLFDRPLNFSNKLLDPTLIIDESAIVAFHDQLEQEHMIESLDWILNTFLPKFLAIIAQFSNKRFLPIIGGHSEVIQEFLCSSITSTRQLCLLFGKHLTRTRIRPLIKKYLATNCSPSLYSVYIASLTSFEPIEQQEFEEIVVSLRQHLSSKELSRDNVEILAVSIKIIATNSEQIHSPSTRQRFLTYILDALVSYSNHNIRTTCPNSSSSTSTSSSSSLSSLPSSLSSGQQSQLFSATKGRLAAAIKSKTTHCNGGRGGNLNNANCNSKSDQQQQTQTKEFMLIIFRHILTCLINPSVRPTDWAHILVTKFLPLLISLANDSADVYVCTYARLMCAQLVETFDTYLNSPKLTRQTADAMLPALVSLKSLTEQIKASNLKRQIECLTHDLNEKFFKQSDENVL